MSKIIIVDTREKGHKNIGEVCRGQQKYAKGYLWRYADDNTN